jgi:tetratricopeptide (TPR) repeat protein
MIIYGTRFYGKTDEVETQESCVHCGRYGKLTSYTGRRFFHIYFIPLIPTGKRTRVTRQCPSCKTGQHLEVSQLPGLTESIRQQLQEITIAAAAGETHFRFGGEEYAVLPSIFNLVPDAYVYLGADETEEFLTLLRTNDAHLPTLFAEAKHAEIIGQTSLAENAYKSIERESESQRELARLHRAQMYFNLSRFNDAAVLAEELDTAYPTDLTVKQLLLDIYSNTKEWEKLASTYEHCFTLNPGLWENKAFLKAYKKACKRCAREPLTTA